MPTSELTLDFEAELSRVSDTENTLDEVDIITGTTFQNAFETFWNEVEFPPHIQLAAKEVFRPGPTLSTGGRKNRYLSAFYNFYGRMPTLSEFLGLLYTRQMLVDGKLTWIGNQRFRDMAEKSFFEANMPVFPDRPWSNRGSWEAWLVRARELGIDPGFNEESIDDHFGVVNTSSCPSHISKFDLRARAQNMTEEEMLLNKVEIDNRPMSLQEARNLPSGTSFRMRGMFGALDTFCQP